MNISWICAVALICMQSPMLAGIGEWRNYTSKKDVVDVVVDGTSLWAASTGGMFAFHQDGKFETFTTAEGLRSVDLTAIASDGRGKIITGTLGGFIHIYDARSLSWQYVTDIASTNQINKRINDLNVYGDTVLVCSDFGLSLLNLSRVEFGDTYSRFGTIPTTLRVAIFSAVIQNGSVWAAISAGATNNFVAVGNLSNPNLLQPQSWSLYGVGNPTNEVRTVVGFNGTVYAGTQSGLYKFDGSAWNPIASLAGQDIVATYASSTELVVCSTSGVVSLVNTMDAVTPYGTSLPFPASSVTISSSGEPVVGTVGGGFLKFNGAWVSFVPNGPSSSQFLSVTVDNEGTVWSATGLDGGGQGIYRLRQGFWKSFSTQNSVLPTNDFHRVSLGCNGSVWASSWGRGVLEIPPGVDTVLPGNLYGRNVGMFGIPSDTSFIVNGTIACDGQGNTWTTIFQAFDQRVLVVRRSDKTWTTLNAKLGSALIASPHDKDVQQNLAVDAFDNLWMVIKDPAYRGLASFNNRGTVKDSIVYHVTAADGLPSSDIKAIVIDRENDLWVGTDRGIGIILDPSRPKSEGSIARYIPLDGTTINSIAVDALNRKWVATPEGVVLLSPDGTQVLEMYTVASTTGRLIDNDVKSIAIDHTTGTVYFGTINGLASLTTTAVQAKEEFDQLLVSPNPYLLPPNRDLTIDGLVENSRIKILSIDGKLIREVSTPGGRIGFWDGKDSEGQYVSSGIYLLIAFSESGDKVGTGKVAVVRR